MKLSNKLVKTVSNFSETYDGLKKAAKDVAEQIEDMKELTEEGAELKISNFSKKTSVKSKLFSKLVGGMKDVVDQATVEAESISDLAETELKADPTLASFARKARLLKKSFSTVDAKFSEVAEVVATALEASATGTNTKESVVPASEGTDPDADPTKTTTCVSPNPPAPGVEKANFSVTEFVKFSLSGAIKAFAEFASELADAGDIVAEVVELTNQAPVEQSVEPKEEVPAQEPAPEAPVTPASPAIVAPEFDLDAAKKELIDKGIEAYKAGDKDKIEEISKEASELETKSEGAGNEVITAIENFAKENKEMKTETTEETCPVCGMSPCECVAPEAKNFSQEQPKDELTKEQESLVEVGIKAFANKDKEALDEVAKKAADLDTRSEGAGTEVVETIENFATLFKLGFGTDTRTFSSKEFCDKAKELLAFAAERLVAGDKWDTDAFASKCDDLEKLQPGAGEIVVSAIENFTKISDSIKEKMTPDTLEKAIKDFSAEIEKFIEDIPVADRTFSHKLKRVCFEALESCDKGDREACVKACDQIGKDLSDPSITDQKLKDFCESLKAFCGRFAKFSTTEKEAEVPAEIAKGDSELNEVLTKMGEKGAQLDAKTSTFATKLCDSYKSMKCFTEAQLENKVKLVEELKDSLTTAGANFAETAPAATEEVKVDSPEESAAAEPVLSVPDDQSSETPEAQPETPATEEQVPAPEVPETPETPVEQLAEEQPKEEVPAPVVTSEVGPGEIAPELVNAAGDETYDPTAIAKSELQEEEEVPEDALPSESSVSIPVNFSEGKDEKYDTKLSTLFDL